MRIEEKIEKAHYAASESDIEQLAASRLANDDAVKRTDGAFLRILVASVQAKTGTATRRKLTAKDIEQQRGVLTDIYAPFYAAVLRGITTPDIAEKEGLTIEERRTRTLERNRRSNFARSAASTLHSFMKLGGDVRALQVDQLKKMDLTRFVAEHRDREPRDVVTGTLQRLERQAAAYLESDPIAGRGAVEECIQRLQELLNQPAAGGGEEPRASHRARGPTVEVLAHTQTGVRRRQQAYG